MAFAIVGSDCGPPGDGIAGPSAHMIAFQASHSSRSTSRIFASAALRIRMDFAVVAGVDPVRVSDALGLCLAVAA
jgi:hypothetical protein